jgi:hypothetical protein
MKLIVAGGALIAFSLVLAPLAGINPLYPALAGIVCTLVGVCRDSQPFPERGGEASPGAATDAATLAYYTSVRPDGGVGSFDTL